MIVASEPAIDRLAIDRSRAVRVIASVTRTERIYPVSHRDAHFVRVGGSLPAVAREASAAVENSDAELTGETAAQAYRESGVAAGDLDVIELHDAFAIEELLYVEAMGLCGAGEAAAMVASGASDLGGRCAVSPSGGLLAMGHPIGPTGIGQIAEITRQLRGEAGPRQQPAARTGLAHMVGVGAVCVVHILQKE